MIQIDKNVPLPPSGAGRPPIYPLREMEVGDSFYSAAGKMKAIATAACKAGKKFGRRYAVRAVDGGVRVWRVE